MSYDYQTQTRIPYIMQPRTLSLKVVQVCRSQTTILVCLPESNAHNAAISKKEKKKKKEEVRNRGTINKQIIAKQTC